MTSSSLAPAGWYRDPLGLPQLRWWNGTMWTNQIEDPPAAVPASAGHRAQLVDSP